MCLEIGHIYFPNNADALKVFPHSNSLSVRSSKMVENAPFRLFVGRPDYVAPKRTPSQEPACREAGSARVAWSHGGSLPKHLCAMWVSEGQIFQRRI